MDHTSRLIGLGFVVAWTIFRLVRYLRIAGGRRAPAALPPSAGTAEEARTDTAAGPVTRSPIESADAADKNPIE